MAADETTPLLPNGTGTATTSGNNVDTNNSQLSSPNTDSENTTNNHHDVNNNNTKAKWTLNPLTLLTRVHVETRILLAAFLITTSFSFTQVPIFYAFHLMECDDFYTHHPPYTGLGDRCSRNEIAAGTATDFSFLAMSTTICGTVNLFFAGWLVKKIGLRLALMAQVLVPAIRVLTQILGVLAGGRSGIVIFQATQLITVLGGPVGYILIINIMVGEVVSPARRTPVFGMLQGCFMLGQAVGYLTGGMIGDAWGIRRPFEVAFVAFLVSTAYVQLALPYVSPESMAGGGKKAGGPKAEGVAAGFFAPLRVLAPQRVRLRSGKVIKHLGVLVLCTGVFLGVLATDFAAMLIQMYATAVFEFRQSDNGWLMSEFALMRAVFLIVLFPRIISSGRKWYAKRQSKRQPRRESMSDQRDPATQGLLIQPDQLEAPMGTLAEEEPMVTQPPTETEDTHFDLFFLRWSLVADGLLTSCTALATKKWHIYLAAAMLPFASGTAPAAKGVMTEMCSPEQRADALNALTLVENIGRLATQGFFGFVFAALAEAGKPHLTFYCNAILAMIAASVLIFSRFPPNGSELIEADDAEEHVNGSNSSE